MKKQYGIFEINTTSQYYNDGANEIRFLPERYLHDTEEDAIRWIPSHDGQFVIMPVFVRTENAEQEELFNQKIEFLNSLKKHFKTKNQ